MPVTQTVRKPLMNTLTANDIASNPELYFQPVKVGRSEVEWECTGYSRTGETIRFSRLLDTGQGVCQINLYLEPSRPVRLSNKRLHSDTATPSEAGESS